MSVVAKDSHVVALAHTVRLHSQNHGSSDLGTQLTQSPVIFLSITLHYSNYLFFSYQIALSLVYRHAKYKNDSFVIKNS
jgi:hypothetical protein